MNKMILIMAGVLLMAGLSSMAAPRKTVIESTTNITNAPIFATTTDAKVQGYIDTVLFDVPAGSVSGSVSLISVLGSEVIATGSVITADTLIRPRAYPTTSSGSAVYTNGSVRYLTYGDTLKFGVTNCGSTNVTWKCSILWDDGK
jgi:hypothetical protein